MHHDAILAEIDRHSIEAEAVLITALAAQGGMARRAYLDLPDFGVELQAGLIVPDAFAQDLIDAAAPPVRAMAETAIDLAEVDVPDRLREGIIIGTMAGTAQHLAAVNGYTREKVGELLIKMAGDPRDEVGRAIQMLVGDLLEEDGRLVPKVARSRTIAQTEVAWASGRTQASAWGEVGVQQVEIFDGPACGWTTHDDSDHASGSIRTLAEYHARPLSHPRCIRTAIPIQA